MRASLTTGLSIPATVLPLANAVPRMLTTAEAMVPMVPRVFAAVMTLAASAWIAAMSAGVNVQGHVFSVPWFSAGERELDATKILTAFNDLRRYGA